MHMARKEKIQLGVILFFLVAVIAWLPQAANSQDPMRMQQPPSEWKPNQSLANGKFVGSDACAECHRSKVTTQKKTPMGMALSSGANCEILRTNPKLTYQQASYSYQLVREGNQTTYTVTDGTNTISLPILYCFGNGEAGQTYVLQYKNKFYESRLSFYNDIRGLDVTMGHMPAVPKNLEDAMGREMSAEETRNCFACHTTNSVSGKTLQLDHLVAGVTCEACHGPGEKHVAAMQAGDFKQKQIFNPKTLVTEEMSNFCGSCHRTWEQVALMGLRGVNNVRFQPYRLTNSKCYDSEDKRISCAACHDPHEERKREPVFYDAKCTACHNAKSQTTLAKGDSSPKRQAVLCKVGKKNCATCHMPKLELPGAHFKFTDHHIRIVRQGEVYPN